MSLSNTEYGQVLQWTGKLPLYGGASFRTPIGMTASYECSVSQCQPATGVMDLTAIFLTQGQTIAGINYVSGTTAASGPTHLWFALYDDGRGSTTAGQLALLGQTSDNGSVAVPANTWLALGLVSPWVTQYTGIYYVAFLQTVSTTMSTLAGVIRGTTASIQLSSNCANSFHSMTAGSGLTNLAPSPSGALTISTRSEFVYVV